MENPIVTDVSDPVPSADLTSVGFDERTRLTAELVDELHRVVGALEALHPGRSFTPDGHLVGSLGEAAAEAMFQLQLTPSSTTGHDAHTADGRPVEIKATYGTSAVAIRPTSHGKAALLVVLRLSRDSGRDHEVVYNGPLSLVVDDFGKVQSNGQARVGLARLRKANAVVPESDRVPRRLTPDSVSG